jgi:hypothetical protein
VLLTYVDLDPNPDLVYFLTKFVFFGAGFSPLLSLVLHKNRSISLKCSKGIPGV